MLKWTLWIDDTRYPNPTVSTDILFWARDVEQAQFYVEQHGPPSIMYLDHDLSVEEKVPDFLKWLQHFYPHSTFSYVEYITANPVGAENMRSFIESWQRSIGV